MFGSVLVANRGEIACRVIRTCRRLGVRTVTVYSEADAGALHVGMADEALPIGPAPAPQSYLDADAVLAAARDGAVDAIHPGYGFLAENAEFAHRVQEAGFVFIGPPAEAIAAMGDKVTARRIAEKAGVPLVEGTEALAGEGDAVAAAERLGYPVFVKASGGGGGIGMSVAGDAGELTKAFATARARAERFFSHPDVYLERYLPRARHVEIQVFADKEGNLVHLYERECSVQRRHQKVIEEAPSAGVDAGLLSAMATSALALAREVGYEGAGTVECLVSGGSFYFLEMNTRLQVEHPVTEETCGEDLVEWQLRIAAGERLSKAQSEIRRQGHSIELRVYAEDPVRFLPSPGKLTQFRPPAGLRVDSGVREGDEITMHYDPLLAKLVARGENREEAIQSAREGIRSFVIEGIKHNLPLHERVLGSEAFRSGDYDTAILTSLGS